MTHFWAKTTPDGQPGISVFEHLVNVGCVARCLAEAFPALLERFRLDPSTVAALAALHDLGKISPGFQRKSDMWLHQNNLTAIDKNCCWDTEMEADHGKVSHSAIQDFLVAMGTARAIAKHIAAVLGAHHGRLKYLPNERGIKPPLINRTTEDLSGIAWETERLECARHIWEYFAPPKGSLNTLSNDSPAIWWLAGITSVADWIGSDERFFSSAGSGSVDDSPTRARQASDSIVMSPPPLNHNLSFEEIFGFPPNDMQEKTIACVTAPGVYIVEASMGMGKTEAALAAAYRLMTEGKARGIYFALPTQATSNRIHLRLNDFLKRISPIAIGSYLIHANSWLMQDDLDLRPASNSNQEDPGEDARLGRDWFGSAKRALLAPFGVGTVDQALLGVVAARHFFVRRFALAGKVVILDEVHSYDLYTGTLVDELITALEGLGCTVIVLSATLSGKRRGQIVPPSSATTDELQPYPLISGRVEGNAFTPCPASPPAAKGIIVDFKTAEAATTDAIDAARGGCAVLWICNTVDAAQAQFKRFRGVVDNDFPLGLLHSRFPYWRREALEEEWMGRFGKSGTTRCGSILVSTQVVEQSVDLDADLLITELAPTDMLLQRLGRLWRHERSGRPVLAPRLCIIEEDATLDEFRHMTAKEIIKALGGKAKVYAPFVLLRSLEVWKKQTDGVTIPLQVRRLIEQTYQDRDHEPDPWLELYEEWYGTDSAKKMKAQMSANIWQPALTDQEGVQTRLNEIETISVIMCRSLNHTSVHFLDRTTVQLDGNDYRFATAKAVHRNIIKAPLHHFHRTESHPAFSQYVHDRYCVGIVDDNGCVMVKGLKEGVRLCYSDKIGLLIEKTT